MTEKKKRFDWAAIEPDWRAGIKTKKMMAEEYGVSRAAMDKHFGNLGIGRDLTNKIRDRAEDKVIQAVAETKVARKVTRGKVTPNEATRKRLAATEDAIVEANAEFVAKQVNLQRAVVGEAVDLSVALIRELAAITNNIEDIIRLGEWIEDDSEDGKARKTDVFNRVTSLAGRIDSGKKGVEMLKTAVELQRKVLRIKDDPEPTATLVLKADPSLSPADAYMRMIGK